VVEESNTVQEEHVAENVNEEERRNERPFSLSLLSRSRSLSFFSRQRKKQENRGNQKERGMEKKGPTS
jgi:hypothetical protein